MASEAAEKKLRLADALARIQQLETENEELSDENEDLQGRMDTIYKEASPGEDVEDDEEEDVEDEYQ
jgi:cell division protein FtsB